MQGAFAFCDFLVINPGSCLFGFGVGFVVWLVVVVFLDDESKILLHVFKSMQNVKSLLVWGRAVGYSELLQEIQTL